MENGAVSESVLVGSGFGADVALGQGANGVEEQESGVEANPGFARPALMARARRGSRSDELGHSFVLALEGCFCDCAEFSGRREEVVNVVGLVTFSKQTRKLPGFGVERCWSYSHHSCATQVCCVLLVVRRAASHD